MGRKSRRIGDLYSRPVESPLPKAYDIQVRDIFDFRSATKLYP
jgi:hypothetical protein